jgi:hypothetical protein
MKTTVLALLLAAVPLSAQSPTAMPLGTPVLEAAPIPAPDAQPLNHNLGYETLHGTPLYYASGEILIWTRRLPSGPLFINQYTGETTADFRDQFRSRWAAGPNVTIGRELGEGWNAEFTYFGLYNMNLTGILQPNRAQPVVANPGDPALRIAPEILPLANFRNAAGAPVVVFDPREAQSVSYTTTINNFEVNLRKNATERFSWLVGFRYINLVDEMIASFYNVNSVNLGGYGVATHNDLYGGQFGVDYTAPLCDPLYVRLTGKTGLFGNAANQITFGTIQASNPANQPLASFHRAASAAQLSFLGQGNLSFVYEVTPRFHITAGYSAMVITGVATAPAQAAASDFSRNGASGISTGANAFYHGMNFGIEYHH